MTHVIEFSEFKAPMDIICNGFSIKETIYMVLVKYINTKMSEELAEEIEEAFAVRLSLRQGEILEK